MEKNIFPPKLEDWKVRISKRSIFYSFSLINIFTITKHALDAYFEDFKYLPLKVKSTLIEQT